MTIGGLSSWASGVAAGLVTEVPHRLVLRVRFDDGEPAEEFVHLAKVIFTRVDVKSQEGWRDNHNHTLSLLVLRRRQRLASIGAAQ